MKFFSIIRCLLTGGLVWATLGLKAQTEHKVDVKPDIVYIATSFMPDPDLLIRTGGELRLSNYLLWQCAYSELYFCDTYWPDFDEEQFRNAIAEYQTRQRRYGLTGEQVENKL